MAREVKHGTSGYRVGCRCEVCRRAKREYQAAWRAGRKDQAAQPVPVTDELPAPEPVLAPAQGLLDLSAPAGPLERALLEDVRDPDDKVAFRRHLLGVAMLNARVLDQIAVLDRLDLLSPVQLRQFEVLGRLARIGFAGLDDDHDGGPVAVPDDVSSLIDELGDSE